MSAKEIFCVTKEEHNKILKSLNKTENELQSCVEQIKEWLKKEAHLPQDEDDRRLKSMLIFNKFSIEKVKKKLDYYYSIRNIIPDLFTNWDLSDKNMQTMLNNCTYTPLPKLNKDLSRVYLFEFNQYSPDIFDPVVYNKFFFITLDVRFIDDECVSEQFIVDYKNLALPHLAKLTPAFFNQMLSIFRHCYSGRIQGIHFVNASSIANTVINIIKSVLPNKISDRIVSYKDVSMLCQVFPKEILPNEYGGEAGSIKDIEAKYKAYLRSKNDWIKEQILRRSDETKRVGEPLDSELFGTSGSFRQLNYD